MKVSTTCKYHAKCLFFAAAICIRTAYLTEHGYEYVSKKSVPSLGQGMAVGYTETALSWRHLFKVWGASWTATTERLVAQLNVVLRRWTSFAS